MFTGIVTDIGKVLETERRGDLRARVGIAGVEGNGQKELVAVLAGDAPAGGRAIEALRRVIDDAAAPAA